MKWFHHETAARHDPKLQMLGSTHGAQGLGIYWCLLEEIGQHSDTFHLKLLGISEQSDNNFDELLKNPEQNMITVSHTRISPHAIPKLPVRILAKNLFTSTRKLLTVIHTCVEVGLFDSAKWLKYHLLYSPSFEQRADDYTRRLHRKQSGSGLTPNTVRTLSEHSPDQLRTHSEHHPESLRTKADKVHLETEAEQKKKRNRTEADKSTQKMPVEEDGIHSLSTPDYYEFLKDELELIELSEEGLQAYSRRFRSVIVQWNDEHSVRFDWIPSDVELQKLFTGGHHYHKVDMCYHAYKLLGEKLNYPELVLRALRLMLRSSQKTRIVNPLGWLWTCLHGSGDGTAPWVQLTTAAEEQSLESTLKKRLRSNS